MWRAELVNAGDLAIQNVIIGIITLPRPRVKKEI
jgi:hypothetical protein